MNWLQMSDDEIMRIADPIMDNLMQASTRIDHEAHVRDFSENLKQIVTKDELERQCGEYQAELGFFDRRELVGVFRRRSDARVFWKQWYTNSDDEFIAFIHIVDRDDRIEVVNVSVS